MYPRSMADSDCVMVMGSNMAENHPVAFRWPMKAKEKGAVLMHVGPRFTLTSTMCDIHAPIPAGTRRAYPLSGDEQRAGELDSVHSGSYPQ